jgi:hypothetical protein
VIALGSERWTDHPAAYRTQQVRPDRLLCKETLRCHWSY